MTLCEFVEAMLAIGASDSTLSPARVEALHGLEVLPVDVSHAKANLAAHFQGYVQIARVHGRGESIIGVVREGDPLVQVVERHYRHDGAENFTADDFHVLPATSNNRWLVEITLVAG